MPRESTTKTECPPEALFVELIEGRLSGPAGARLQLHIQACTGCHALVDELTMAATEPAHGEDEDRIAHALLAGGTTANLPEHLDPAAPALGQIIGGSYHLVRLLGAGGMGSVYEAERTETGERVAVKLINGRLLVRGSEAPSRFRREARAAGAIRSAHIVRVVDSGMDEATSDLYLVMEYLRGEDLQQLIDRAAPLSPGVVLRIAAQALVGLTEAHAAGIVHRDIKPANLFLARSGDGAVTVKLLDFGIAKIAPDPLSLPDTTGLTNTGGLLGSPLYMSPEQVQNSKDVDHRTDLWSLGSALYAALVGRAPHQDATSVGKLILAICGTPAPPLREVAPWIPPDVAAAVHRALAIDREGRYPSAAAMLDALRLLVGGDFALREEMLVRLTPAERAARVLSPGEPERARPAPPRARSRARLAAGALVVGIAAAGYGVARSRGPAPLGPGDATAPPPTIDLTQAPPVTPASVAPVASTPRDARETERRVLLVVLPADAAVEVDGARAPVQDGAVEIAGALGSEHRVRVLKGESELVASVTVTEKGAAPPKVELPARRPPSAVKPPAEGAPAGSKPGRSPEARDEELMRKPE